MWFVASLSPDGKSQSAGFENDGAKAFMSIMRLQHEDGRLLKGPFLLHLNDGKGTHQVKVSGDQQAMILVDKPTQNQVEVLTGVFTDIAALLNEMEANGELEEVSQEELAINVRDGIAETLGAITRYMAMPFEEAHDFLQNRFSYIYEDELDADEISRFLRVRPDAESLIFHHADLPGWLDDELFCEYTVAGITMRNANLFDMACLLSRADVIEALDGLFTPNMAISSPNKHTGEMSSSSVLESAIWHTSALGKHENPAVEAEIEVRRRRVFDQLLNAGASHAPIKLSRAPRYPSNGDPLAAATLSNNKEAADAIHFARNQREGIDIGAVVAPGTPKPVDEDKKGWGGRTL